MSAAETTWCVTGCAGFIGSHLIEALLREGARVTGLDNFATGFRHNLDEVRSVVGEAAWRNFRFIEGDITDEKACADACAGAGYVLHQAALGSVPRSVSDPKASHRANVEGFLSMITAARDAKVRGFIYASSSSVYGDEPALPKREEKVGNPLSPYAATKWVNEIYADVFQRVYSLRCVGLRYFNVFGPRQDPNGAYAAVIPRWLAALRKGEAGEIYGDGQSSRDFCYVSNVVQANLQAARSGASGVFNIAIGEQMTLVELYSILQARFPGAPAAVLRDFRAGDVRHSRADITRAREAFGYSPDVPARAGLELTARWYSARR